MFDILDIHETSASEAEFYETSSSETDMGVDHLFMVVWVARIIYILLSFTFFLFVKRKAFGDGWPRTRAGTKTSDAGRTAARPEVDVTISPWSKRQNTLTHILTTIVTGQTVEVRPFRTLVYPLFQVSSKGTCTSADFACIRRLN